MTPQQRQWLLRAQRRIASLEPDMRAQILLALQQVVNSMTDAELTRAIASGDLQRILDTILTDPALDRALYPIRQQMRRTLMRTFQYATADLPRGGKVNGTVAVQFDWLNPTVVQAIQTMESRALDTLKADIRATVRQAVQAGLEAGQAPSSVARGLRATIGLAPNQEAYIRNLRAELEAGRYSDAMRRVLLDKRFNLSNLDNLSAAERAKRIDTIVSQYEKRWTAHNANVNAKLMTMDAYREGQWLAWTQAVTSGVVPDGYEITKTWRHLDPQLHPRPEHQALDGETVPITQPYSTGQMTAGLGDYGCHCRDQYRIRRVLAA